MFFNNFFYRLGKQAIEEKKNGRTAKALYCLKRKKSLQEILEKRLQSMETMDTVLMKIESSQDDLQVFWVVFLYEFLCNKFFLIY